MMCYARSGGTLLNRCLSCLPKTLVFSEINPDALCPTKYNTIKLQAKYWYGINTKDRGFESEVGSVYEYCATTDKTLVVRDWSFGSFVPLKYNNFSPSCDLSLLSFARKNFEARPFAFVQTQRQPAHPRSFRCALF